MKAKGTQKEKGKRKKMTDEEFWKRWEDPEFRKDVMKQMDRAVGIGRYELTTFEIVYCHATDKFVNRHGCHFCRAMQGDYSDSRHKMFCDKANDEASPTSGAWTLEEMIGVLTEERKRVLKEKAEEMEDRKKYGPIHKDTPEEIRERERFVRALSHVSFEDMHKPFTI